LASWPLILVLVLAVLGEAAEGHGLTTLGICDALADLGRQVGVTPHNHLSLRCGHHGDQQQYTVYVALDAVSPPGLSAGLTEAYPPTAVYPRLGDGLEALRFYGVNWAVIVIYAFPMAIYPD
jgi:hypothetical protein